ncbi:MAG: hypothetical protein PWQ96_1033 [Clostridia bacterium]|jgi:hypothetical protein|nr:hypothetical protein [Clostridiales bacterium]MDK2985391.1 hypothetical protein [Clostridia bacterium]
MKKKKLRGQKVKAGHPEDNQFIEGKIGSGFMSTLEGQPHEDESMVEKVGAETPGETQEKQNK